MGQWRLPCEKSFIYETDIRVPFYMRGPGITAGSSTDIMIGNVDIMPSILDFADVDIPANVDGKSFKSQILNTTTPADQWREIFLSEYMAHANQYFNICGTWFPEQNNFKGQVKHPNPVDQSTNDYIWVDYGDYKDAMGSNTWRNIRIINSTVNWGYAEYVNSSFTEDAKKNPYLRMLFDIDKDPYQVNNIYDSVSKDIQSELHQMLMDYGSCGNVTCP